VPVIVEHIPWICDVIYYILYYTFNYIFLSAFDSHFVNILRRKLIFTVIFAHSVSILVEPAV